MYVYPLEDIIYLLGYEEVYSVVVIIQARCCRDRYKESLLIVIISGVVECLYIPSCTASV